MKFQSTLSKTLLFILIILSIVIVRLIPFSFGHYLGKRIINIAKNNNIIVELENPSYRPILGLKANTLGAQILIDKIFIPIKLDATEAAFPIYEIIGNKIGFSIKGNGYGGSLEAKIDSRILGKKTEINTEIRNFDLAEYPITAGLQVEGKVSINSKATFVDDGINLKTLQSGKIAVSITNGSWPQGFKIKTKNKLLSSITFPKVSNIELTAELNYLNSYFTLSSLNIDSSLAKVTGKGGIVVIQDAQSFGNGRLRINISLTQEGARVLRPYFALATSSINNISDNWLLNIQFEPKKSPQIELIPSSQ